MERRDFLIGASLGALGTAFGGEAAAQAGAQSPAVQRPADAVRAPNIVLIITDQNRAGLSRRAGFPFDTSPRLDALAAQGVEFRKAYCTAPVCVPSRVSMLTGRWPTAHRVRMNLDADQAFYSRDLYQVAHDAGYRTGLAGKNHTYLKPERVDFWREYQHLGSLPGVNASPNAQKFDGYLKSLQFNVGLKPSPFPLETQLPYRITSDAIEFIDTAGNQPFFLQLSIPEPHDPEQVPVPYFDMFPPASIPDRRAGPEALDRLGYRAQWLHRLEQSVSPAGDDVWRRYVSNYLGALRMIDDQVGRFLDALAAKGLSDNTIVIRVSDHGDYFMDYGLARKGVGMPESLARIPMQWTGPGIVKDDAVGDSVFVSMADLMPTLCEVMGQQIPAGVQGRSLWPLLAGETYPKDEFRSVLAEVGVGGLYYDANDRVPLEISKGSGGFSEFWDELNKVTQSGSAKMVRMKEWKLIYDMMGYGQLYHLPSDPLELNNRFGHQDVSAIQNSLMAELAMWTIRTGDSLPTGPQSAKYQTKWAGAHNWYAPYRQGSAPVAFVP